ncbi:MAG: nitrate reductase catalytic subunit, partial [Moorea sp. SIO3G5]|nr:nitrate reductase catalytic subunit [Moorena sp. SIO3G5]
RRGTCRFPAQVTKAITPGTVFAPMHWGALWANQAEANALTHPESCPISLEPELKACAVNLVPISETDSMRSQNPNQEPLGTPILQKLKVFS